MVEPKLLPPWTSPKDVTIELDQQEVVSDFGKKQGPDATMVPDLEKKQGPDATDLGKKLGPMHRQNVNPLLGTSGPMTARVGGTARVRTGVSHGSSTHARHATSYLPSKAQAQPSPSKPCTTSCRSAPVAFLASPTCPSCLPWRSAGAWTSSM